MANFDVDSRTVYFARHGSHAYGLNIPTSDEDFKGICVKPKECYYGIINKFEQLEHMGSKSDGVDRVIYAVDKFVDLASNCNPNIIEILNIDNSDILKLDRFGEELLAFRDEFISKKVRFTFAGYAADQLSRIETHRSWLLNPPKNPPKRSDFDLHETEAVSKSELGAYDGLLDQHKEIVLPKEIVTLFTKEKRYHAALVKWKQYQKWLQDRNPARAQMEADFGYDCKHGMHLIRLMRMCVEILSTGKVNVKREDKEDLLEIRFGKRSYDSLIEEAKRLDETAKQLYETSSLRHAPDKNKINNFLVSFVDRYLSKNG